MDIHAWAYILLCIMGCMLTVCTLVIACILVVHVMVSCAWTKNVIEKYTVLHGQFDTSHIPHLSAAGNP